MRAFSRSAGSHVGGGGPGCAGCCMEPSIPAPGAPDPVLLPPPVTFSVRATLVDGSQDIRLRNPRCRKAGG